MLDLKNDSKGAVWISRAYCLGNYIQEGFDSLGFLSQHKVEVRHEQDVGTVPDPIVEIAEAFLKCIPIRTEVIGELKSSSTLVKEFY